jgi:hypothetical protein
MKEPAETLARSHGQVSPLFPAVPGEKAFELRSSGALLFLIPKSPAALLARLINDFGEDIRASSYISHGHVAVVVQLEDRDSCERLAADLDADLRAIEIWPFAGDLVSTADTIVREPSPVAGWIQPPPIDSTELQSEARAQVDQFNSNLAMFGRLASLYAPELAELVSAVRDSVAFVVERLVELHTSGGDGAVREALGLEVHLVEVNAILTIYTSQIGSGSSPLGGDLFPVGEYSLLGIGSMCRGAWRIYSHLNRTFSRHDHAGIIQRAYPSQPPFDPYAPSGRVDYSAWNRLALRVEELDEAPEDEARQHIPYFSSRWGFHESWNAISLSWQCLYAAASKEWNLLTITHEYLHAHVRDIFGVILDPEAVDLISQLLEDYNSKRPGANALASMRLAYVEAIMAIDTAMNVAETVSGTRQSIDTTVPDQVSEEDLRILYKRHTELIHEIVVHVLDYWYIYDGRDDVYVNSIWSSWSLVPSVANRVPYYVLRTLAALASTSPPGTNPAMFEDAASRLLDCLKAIEVRDRARPVVNEAIRLLEQPESRRRLGIQFSSARFVVELTLHFFKDSRLNAALVRDDAIAVVDDTRTYNVEFGTYPGLEIDSPVAFLLDRFPGYEEQAGSDRVEHESIWQMLQLV